MTKKVNKIKVGTKLSKTLHDDLMRHSKDNNIYITDIVETAIKEYIHPYDKETHEKHTKMQLATTKNMLIGITNRLDITLICFEEFVKTFYRNIPELALEDSHAAVAINARIADGLDNFLKRVLDSGINNNPNILSTFNITKPQ